MTKKSLIEAAAALVGSAGIGAVMMYIFDPELGERRRSKIGDAASSALDSTLRNVADQASNLSSKAQSLANSLSGAAAEQASHLAEQSRELGSHAAGMMGRLWNRASSTVSDELQQTGESARSYGRRATKSARRAFGYEPQHSPAAKWTGITAGTLGALVVGAGVVYLIDPVRRRRFQDRAAVYAHRGSRYIQDSARHLTDHFRGGGSHHESWDGSAPASMPQARSPQSSGYQSPPGF